MSPCSALPIGSRRPPTLRGGFIGALLLLGVIAGPSHAQDAAPVRVTVDTSAAPETAPWAEQAAALVEKWHPIVARLLHSDGHAPPTEVRLVFKDMKGVAYTSGQTITISTRWIKDHPDDYGMVVHELTHVIQDYGRRKGERPGWLVEGIADYVRFAHFEPGTKIVVNPRRASYRDGYRTTAKFLGWVEKTTDKGIVPALNAALRAGTYDAKMFEDRTTKTLDALWAEFLAAEQRK